MEVCICPWKFVWYLRINCNNSNRSLFQVVRDKATQLSLETASASSWKTADAKAKQHQLYQAQAAFSNH
jgi:hypothetical protein